jgi:molecular chaperone GrpE
MMDTNKRRNEAEQPVGGPDGAAAQDDAAALEPDAVAEAAGESQAETIERLEAEKADLTERLLRVAADLDNLRKRAERDVADAGRYAIARFAADMLTVGDNLRRALDAVPEELRQSGDAGAAALIEGVEMTARELDRLLAKNGVVRIAAEGERFDPHRHQAMFEVPDPDVPPGTVVQVVQDGFMIGERVLRAAMVGVAKAAPGSQAEEAEAQSAEIEGSSGAARSG